jgi:uncharacterized damage-inducible protein DinB
MHNDHLRPCKDCSFNSKILFKYYAVVCAVHFITGYLSDMEITSVASFLEYYKRLRERTNRLAAVIPPQYVDWAYKPGKYTIGDMLRHMAALERYMFAENVMGRASCYHGCGKELADGYDAVLAYFNEMHRQSVTLFRTLTDDDLKQKCRTPGGAEIARWKWLRAMAEHEIHHRGELYIYLNLLGVTTPPMFGLTAEEVQQKSIGMPGISLN